MSPPVETSKEVIPETPSSLLPSLTVPAVEEHTSPRRFSAALDAQCTYRVTVTQMYPPAMIDLVQWSSKNHQNGLATQEESSRSLHFRKARLQTIQKKLKCTVKPLETVRRSRK